MTLSPVTTGRELSCWDLALWRASLPHLGQGFQGPESTCVSFPGSLKLKREWRSGNPGNLVPGPFGWWRRWGWGWPRALWPAWCGAMSRAFPLLDLWLHSSWYLYAATFFLVLLSGDATGCHLPPVALLGVYAKGLCCLERGGKLSALLDPFARRWASQDWPRALRPASNKDIYLHLSFL